jgi:hypothetical protein
VNFGFRISDFGFYSGPTRAPSARVALRSRAEQEAPPRSPVLAPPRSRDLALPHRRASATPCGQEATGVCSSLSPFTRSFFPPPDTGSRGTLCPRRRQAGAAAIVAVAIIVILGALGATLVATARIGHVDTVYRIQEAQAFYDADAGIAWATRQESETLAPMSLGAGTFSVAQVGDAWVSVGASGDARRQIRSEPQPAGESISNGLDYVADSRIELDGWFVRVVMMNATDADMTFNKIKATWDDPEAYYQTVFINVLNESPWLGTWAWTYLAEPGFSRAGSGETKQFNLTDSITIPAHHSASVWLDFFRENQHGSGGDVVNMDDTEFTIQFLNGDSVVGTIVAGTRPE